MGTLRCLHCRTPLNIADETLDQDVSCPTCGSRSPFSVPAEQKTQTVRTVIGRFELLEPVGKGQFGTVWRARDTRLERIIALKVPRREELDLHTRHIFQRDANAAAALNHPNIVRVYEVLEEDGQIYIVSEFINGDDLKVCLGSDAFSTWQEVVRFMISTAEAVHYAHGRGIIHRDIKPGNILVDGVHQPHLTDFGLAKIESYEKSLTVFGDQLVGTISYMSPEQAANVHNLDHRSDVFSLGVILYEMLTRHRPFSGEGLDIVDKVRHHDPVKPRALTPELPRDLETVCLKALEKDPATRYQTALELAEDLKRCLAGQPTIARPVTRRELASRWIRKHVTIAIILMTALLGTVAAAATFFRTQSTVLVELTSVPAGAEFAIFPLDPVTAQPIDEKVVHTARSQLNLTPGDYWVTAKLENGRFQEVYRHVPRDPYKNTVLPALFPHRMWWRDDNGVVQLPKIFIPESSVNEGMACFRENDPAGKPAFYLESHEVSIDAFKKPFKGSLPGNFKIPDSGPLPLTGMPFDYAVWYAELVGKRLPTDSEFEFAATNGGASRFPWGDREVSIPRNKLSSVDELTFDVTLTNPPVYGLVSNADEFTATPHMVGRIGINAPTKLLEIPRDGRPVGAFSVGLFDLVSVRGTEDAATSRSGISKEVVGHNVGFRCARSKTPKW